MGKLIVRSTRVKLGGTLYSAQVKAATLQGSASEVDVTNFESDGWGEIEVGLRKGKLTLELVKDSDLSGLDTVIGTYFESGADLAFELIPADDTVSASNRKYTGNVKVTEWTPISGAVGTVAGGSVTFPVNGKITAATS
ncbi:MAG: hypothetical protein IPQ07_39975 [Myxococcales bacterium]|nr:hypothetical protein [Myxococcales bacterium]